MTCVSVVTHAEDIAAKFLKDIVENDFGGSWIKACMAFQADPRDLDFCQTHYDHSRIELLDKIVDYCRKTGRIQSSPEDKNTNQGRSLKHTNEVML